MCSHVHEIEPMYLPMCRDGLCAFLAIQTAYVNGEQHKQCDEKESRNELHGIATQLNLFKPL